MNALSPMMLREAVATVSLTHQESCRCRICRAASGDPEAFAEVLIAVTDVLDRFDVPPTRESREER